jgi:hypothetical protein
MGLANSKSISICFWLLEAISPKYSERILPFQKCIVNKTGVASKKTIDPYDLTNYRQDDIKMIPAFSLQIDIK